MERDPVEIVVTVDILALDKMMRYLNVRDLLSCRLVSDLWNTAASLKLRQRSTMIKTISNESQLMQLEDCINLSWNFPFAGLKFDSPRELQSDDAMEFFKEHGPRFTRLSLETNWTGSLDDLAPFIYRLPRLSILELRRPPILERHCPSIPELRHFHSHPTTSLFVQPLGSAAGQADDVPTLPSIRTIRIHTSSPGDNEEVLGQVLAAASPPLQIECWDSPTGILRVLKSAGKFRALSIMKFDEVFGHPKCHSEIDQLLVTESPSLTRLDFHRYGCLSKYGLKKLLFASQRTLTELHLSGICLSQLSVYKRLAFTKLTTLSFDFEICNDCEYLFPGRHEGNFPALKHLKLKLICQTDNIRVVFADDLVIPTVTSIDLDGYVNKDGMKTLAQMFPNVSEVRLDSQYYSGQFMPCGSDPSDMWNVREFKRLEKLWSSGTLLLDNKPRST